MEPLLTRGLVPRFRHRHRCLQSSLASFALRSQIFRSVLKGISLQASLFTLKMSAQWSVQRLPPPDAGLTAEAAPRQTNNIRLNLRITLIRFITLLLYQ